MMAMLTNEMLSQMIDDDPTLLTDLLSAALPRPQMADWILPKERWPDQVYYHHGKVTYVPRDHFLFRIDPDGPSDCQWIVPGSTP